MKQSKKELLREIIRFLLVGGIATIGDYIIFYLFNFVILSHAPETLNLVLSTFFGFFVGLLINWFLQAFVFKYIDEKQTKSKKIFLKFVIISVIGLLITEIGMISAKGIYGLYEFNVFDWFSFDFWKLFMKCLMTCIVLVWNYFGRKLFVFKRNTTEES